VALRTGMRAVLQPLIDDRFAQARRAGEREPHEADAADAFTDLCRGDGGRPLTPLARRALDLAISEALGCPRAAATPRAASMAWRARGVSRSRVLRAP
jgi:hypothetical protein